VHIPKIDIGVKRFNEFYQNPKSTVQMQNGQTIHFTLQIKLNSVDKNTIISNKVVAAKYYDSIVPYIDIDINGRHCIKRLMMLDIVANNSGKTYLL
jgi:hypothetical protein